MGKSFGLVLICFYTSWKPSCKFSVFLTVIYFKDATLSLMGVYSL